MKSAVMLFFVFLLTGATVWAEESLSGNDFKSVTITVPPIANPKAMINPNGSNVIKYKDGQFLKFQPPSAWRPATSADFQAEYSNLVNYDFGTTIDFELFKAIFQSALNSQKPQKLKDMETDFFQSLTNPQDTGSKGLRVFHEHPTESDLVVSYVFNGYKKISKVDLSLGAGQYSLKVTARMNNGSTVEKDFPNVYANNGSFSVAMTLVTPTIGYLSGIDFRLEKKSPDKVEAFRMAEFIKFEEKKPDPKPVIENVYTPDYFIYTPKQKTSNVKGAEPPKGCIGGTFGGTPVLCFVIGAKSTPALCMPADEEHPEGNAKNGGQYGKGTYALVTDAPDLCPDGVGKDCQKELCEFDAGSFCRCIDHNSWRCSIAWEKVLGANGDNVKNAATEFMKHPLYSTCQAMYQDVKNAEWRPAGYKPTPVEKNAKPNPGGGRQGGHLEME